MKKNEDPTKDWDDLTHEEIVSRVADLRAKAEAIPTDIIDDILADMDIGVYSKKGELLGEKSFLVPGAVREDRPYPFMFLSRLRNSTSYMFLKIVYHTVTNPRYEVAIADPELLLRLGLVDAVADAITVQCQNILTRSDINSEFAEIDLNGLDLELLAINCKLFTAILDHFEERIDDFLDINI
ncbi:hypothetical protein IJT17_10205 [bacterium]|nr:hypothetical protein [bacterium]